MDQSNSPSPQIVEAFHINSDLDQDKNAQHHSIGTNEFQAAAGSHVHNGSDSLLLLDGKEITGSRGTSTAIPSIISILVGMGAKDSTTA